MSDPCRHVADHAAFINGLTIYYRDWGEPRLPPLVVLHGLGAHARSWDHVAAALADRYRIVVPDLRGHGRSSWAADYTWQLLLDDTIGLLDRLGLRQPALCGHSLGGRVAYMLASRHPERVGCLVIAEACPVDPPADDRSRPPPPLKIESYETMEAALAEAYQRQPYADKAALRHEVEHGLKVLDDGRWVWRMDSALQTARWHGQLNPGPTLEWQALAHVQCPSIVMYGVHSMPFERAAAVARAIPACRLQAIPNAAHDLPNENPAGFIRALRAFLGNTIEYQL